MNSTTRMSVTQAAAYTGLAVSTLNKKRMDGSGPCFIRLSARRIVYDSADIEKWLSERRRTSTSDPGNAGQHSAAA